jgi:uncharacterized protein YodC (DUF2158 family)
MTDVVMKPGDLVVLRAGGPMMVVEKVIGDKVACTWQVDGRVHWKVFSSGHLRPRDGRRDDG